jgi:hypothetical protein
MTTTTIDHTLGAPRWAERAAHLIPLLTLPSGLWRIALVIGLPIMDYGYQLHTPDRLCIVSLSVVQEATAFLCLGLVQPWGEVVPRWVPFIGGSRVRPMAAVVPALTGAAILCVLWAITILQMPFVGFYDHFDGTFDTILVTTCYLPLLAWGPLLAAVALDYRRRRC